MRLMLNHLNQIVILMFFVVPPKVDFIGGGGRGVTGSAIVNAIGRVIGVAIGGAGSGFTSPPLLTFVDSCGNGSAAGGYPRIKDGKIVDVVITEPARFLAKYNRNY